MKNLLMLLAVGMILSASKCTPKTAMNLADVPDIKNIRWVLSSLGGEAVNLPDGAEAFLSLDPEEKTISGNGGCNKLFGGLELAGEALSFNGLGATKKYCEGSMDTEKGFMNALRNTQSFKLDKDGMLNLLGEKGKELAGLSKVMP